MVTGGGEAFLKAKLNGLAIFEGFSKEGSPLFGARRRGARDNLSQKNISLTIRVAQNA